MASETGFHTRKCHCNLDGTSQEAVDVVLWWLQRRHSTTQTVFMIKSVSDPELTDDKN